jgi:hypothetical protein
LFRLSENTLRLNTSRARIDPTLDFRIGGHALDYSNTPLTHGSIGLTIRGYGFRQETGIVIFLDALGIKEIWRRFPAITVIKMWNSVNSFFKSSLDRNQPYFNAEPFFRTLSDTIIITIPCQLNADIIEKTFDLLLQPFIQSVKTQMFLRGIVSYGTYYLSEKLIIGPALDDAAYHHDKLNWIGVSISPTVSQNVSGLNNIIGNNFVCYNNIPHKHFNYSGLVLNWPIKDTDKGCYSILQSESMKFVGSVKQKYDNALIFYNNIDLRSYD